ncbi:MAG: malectin [Oscillospiraceae bacterium]|nr:malectin [Oscillospiraceae bacterium]
MKKKIYYFTAILLILLMVGAAFTGCKLRDDGKSGGDGIPSGGDETPDDSEPKKEYKPLIPTDDYDYEYVPPSGPVPMDTFRLNCGGGALRDLNGNEWEGDYTYDPGYYGRKVANVATYAVGGTNTEIPDLYKSIVYANPLEYIFDNIIPGIYKIKLYTAETHYPDGDANARTFSVFINGVLYEADICPSKIGGLRAAYEPEYVVEIGDEPLIITLRASVDFSLLAGIEITPATAEDLSPEIVLEIDPTDTLRINCGSNNYTDSSGILWESDRVYIKGSWGFSSDGTGIAPFTEIPFDGAVIDPQLYQLLRYAPDITYIIDHLIPGDYTVNFYLSDPHATSKGRRIFDILINGTVVADSIDLFDVGQSVPHIITSEFSVAEGRQTKISFIGHNSPDGNALINAIEILPK